MSTAQTGAASSGSRFAHRLVPVIGAFLIALSVLGCELGPQGVRRDDIGNQLVAWTQTAKPGDRIALADPTDFEWDRVLIAPPYSTNDMAQEGLGFAWNVEAAPSYGNEGLNLLGFAVGDRIAAWSVVKRFADFAATPDGNPSVLDKSAALFLWNGTLLVPVDAEPS